MARTEADREDLMREAVALCRRVELQVPDHDQPVVAGYRTAGWLTIYFGPDPMYQFDERCRLRRAFVEGRLYRTQESTLAQLTRQRTETETILARRDLSELELAKFRSTMLGALASLRERLIRRQAILLRQIPTDDRLLLDDLLQSLDRILSSTEFLAPTIPGKH